MFFSFQSSFAFQNGEGWNYPTFSHLSGLWMEVMKLSYSGLGSRIWDPSLACPIYSFQNHHYSYSYSRKKLHHSLDISFYIKMLHYSLESSPKKMSNVTLKIEVRSSMAAFFSFLISNSTRERQCIFKNLILS